MSVHSWLRAWWWTALFCGSVALLYGQAMARRSALLQDVTLRLNEIEREMVLALEEKETLALSLASQSDPAWMELVLLRQMGVVPEGFLKVHFKR